MSEPVTLTCPTITAAERLARLITVNSLAVSLLRDDRAPAPLTAAQPEPNARPRSSGGVTEKDYLDAWKRERTAAWDVLDAERFHPHRLARATALHAAARRDLQEVEDALRASLAPRTRPGHPTWYRVRVPELHFRHAQYGLHARTNAHTATIDTASLTGLDLIIFRSFLAGFPARGQWPLYAPHNRDGLRKVDNHPRLIVGNQPVNVPDAMRVMLERLILHHPGSIPKVHAADDMEERQKAAS